MIELVSRPEASPVIWSGLDEPDSEEMLELDIAVVLQKSIEIAAAGDLEGFAWGNRAEHVARRVVYLDTHLAGVRIEPEMQVSAAGLELIGGGSGERDLIVELGRRGGR